MPDFSLESRYRTACRIVGIDEAGRGPWAGPVVAAAVWLDSEATPATLLCRLDDSKKLSAARRAELYDELVAIADIGVGIASVEEIDNLNILQASLAAMSRAVAGLNTAPDFALVDGNKLPRLAFPAEAVIKGDGRSLSVAAASIVAKVRRDRIMAELAAEYPGYGWERNQGYGTAEHQKGIASFGVTLHHRRSFRPIREALNLNL